MHTARPGEVDIPKDLPERELTRGWLKASHRAIDPERSKPWRPWHPLTRAAQKPVEPGKIEEYKIEILTTGNLFKAGHRQSVSTSPASTCRAAWPVPTMSNMRPIIFAAARPWYIRSSMTSSTRAIWCCRSFRWREY